LRRERTRDGEPEQDYHCGSDYRSERTAGCLKRKRHGYHSVYDTCADGVYCL